MADLDRPILGTNKDKWLFAAIFLLFITACASVAVIVGSMPNKDTASEISETE